MCVLKTARANVKGLGSIWPKRRSGVLPAAPAPGRVPRAPEPFCRQGQPHSRPCPRSCPGLGSRVPTTRLSHGLAVPSFGQTRSHPARPPGLETARRPPGSKRTSPGGAVGGGRADTRGARSLAAFQAGRGGDGGAEAPLSPGVTPASPFSAPPVGAG